MLFAYAAGNSVVLNWPPDGTSGLTTVFGSHVLDGSGHLVVTNNAGTGSAYTYVTAMSSAITDFVMEADGLLSGSAGVAGLVGRTTFTATTQDNGYRFDATLSGTQRLRLFRCDSTSLTSIATDVNLSGYYLTAGNAVTYHMTMTGTTIDCWLSASGQSDTSHITATDSTYANGRVALLSFLNVAGLGGPTRWDALRVTF